MLTTANKHEPADSSEVFGWPEFKALCDRLGINHWAATIKLSIHLAVGHAVTVDHQYLAEDECPP